MYSQKVINIILENQQIAQHAVDMPPDQRHKKSSHSIKDVVDRRQRVRHTNGGEQESPAQAIGAEVCGMVAIVSPIANEYPK